MKMKTNFLRWLNKKGINFFISIILLIMLIGGIFTFYSRYIIEQQREKSTLAQQVILDLKQLSTFVMLADVGVRGYMLVQEDRFIAPFTYAHESYSSTLKSIEEGLKQQNYTQLDTMAIVKADISAYMEMLDKMYQLAKNGQVEGAQAMLYKDRGLDLMQNYNRFSAKVKAYEAQLLAEANSNTTSYINLMAYIQGLLLMLGIPTLIWVIVRIRKTEKQRKQLFKELDESNKKYIFNPATADDVLKEENVIQSIINNLKQAADFIQKITAGDYDVNWKGLNDTNQTNNKENLAGELIQMREQMKKVQVTDKRRLWATEGLSKVAEISRKYQQDTDQLGEKLVTHVVQYLAANQAALFVLAEGEDAQTCLELNACYAYERKKYLKKSIAIGEGLVGQAYLEAETIYMTEIPEDYINITSGLGKARPGSILIVPLKYNDIVMGVLEIASFKPFEAYQIQFVESLGEIIASSLSTVKTNERTRILLEQSQEQAEEMRAQEEEMRQNMEELQATQEEMQRKTKEYEAIIQQYQQINHEVKTE